MDTGKNSSLCLGFWLCGSLVRKLCLTETVLLNCSEAAHAQLRRNTTVVIMLQTNQANKRCALALKWKQKPKQSSLGVHQSSVGTYQWFAAMGEYQGVRSMMYEKFMYWLKDLTPRVDIVDIRKKGGRDSSVGKWSASHFDDPGSNPGRGLTRVTQYMNERSREYQL